MVSRTYVQQKIYRGYDIAARHIGMNADVYRSFDSFNPIKPEKIITNLDVLPSTTWQFMTAKKFGNLQWILMLDGGKVQPFDYIVTTSKVTDTLNYVYPQAYFNYSFLNYSESGPLVPSYIWYIYTMGPLQPIMGMECNRVVSISRPSRNTNNGANSYGGFTPENSIPLFTECPVAILLTNREEKNAINLPLDTKWQKAQMFVPNFPNSDLRVGDIIDDDRGVRYAINGLELTEMGWRVNLGSVEV